MDVVGGDCYDVLPKWAYMGEASYKMYLREYIRDYIGVTVRIAGIFRTVAVAMGPNKYSRVPRREQRPTTREQITASKWWPPRPGEPAYGPMRKKEGVATCGMTSLAATSYTGSRFAPEMYHNAVIKAISKGTGLPDLPRDYNNGGGLLYFYQEGVFPKEFQEIELYSGLAAVPSDDDIKKASATVDAALQADDEDFASLGASAVDKLIGDVEVRVPDAGAPKFLPRVALLVQPVGFPLFAPSGGEPGDELGFVEEEANSTKVVNQPEATVASPGIKAGPYPSSTGQLVNATAPAEVLYALFDKNGMHLTTRRPFRPVLLVGAPFPALTHSPDMLPEFARSLIAVADNF